MDFFTPDIARLRGRANRGYEHVFLKNAFAETPDVTTVEAGNVFSPGAWTCGIGVVWKGENGWRSAEDLPLDSIEWRFEDGENGGIAPVLCSKWSVDGFCFHSRLAHIGGEGASGVDYAWVEVCGEAGKEFGVLVRDIGPAGGVISSLSWDEINRTLRIEGGATMCLESAPKGVHIWPSDEQHESPAALLCWPMTQSNEKLTLKFRVEHGFASRSLGTFAAPAPHGPDSVDAGFELVLARWNSEVPVRIRALAQLKEVPTSPDASPARLNAAASGSDARVARVWDLACHHLLAASEAGMARIGALNYPHLWLRDGVLVVRAFDLMERHDLARIACDEIGPQTFAGGFGAESDAPGQGIWALVSHGRATNDWEWLNAQWPHIQTRLDWIERMMTTHQPLRALASGRIPGYLATPAINVVCGAAQNGCIAGRMDWHAPDFFINCWSVRGLRDGAFAAQIRGDENESVRWMGLAEGLERAVFEHLLPHFGNPRDGIITPYPSGTLGSNEFLPALRERFAQQFRAQRLDENGRRAREPLWTYFEVAQIHNAFRLGLVEEAWVCLDALLDDELELGVWPEGEPGGNEFLPFGNGANRRGWLDPKTARAGNGPHGWTCAEVVNLLSFLGGREDTLFNC